MFATSESFFKVGKVSPPEPIPEAAVDHNPRPAAESRRIPFRL